VFYILSFMNFDDGNLRKFKMICIKTKKKKLKLYIFGNLIVIFKVNGV